ncbi:MAG TPA: NepR family anti-sigma factor, partial [Sphingomonas sp.]|nr:NepR family anti-sigma factor [Sphingomonas sp.]
RVGHIFYGSRIRPARRDAQGDEVASKTDDKAPRRKDGKAGGQERDVGEALRAVYQDAASETVPDEMLELLKKLG